jgi:hypothetical protein
VEWWSACIFNGYRELSNLQLTCLKECYIPTPNALVCKQCCWPRYFRLWIWRWRPIIDADHHSTVWVNKIILTEVYCSETGSFVTDIFYVQRILPINNHGHLSYSIQRHLFSITYRIMSLNLIWLNMMNWIWYNLYLNFCHKRNVIFLRRMHLFVNNIADPDISDYEFDADDLLLMPIIIPQFE